MTEKEIPGWQKLLDDCDAVEAAFADPEFKGEFKMSDWGVHPRGHEPEAQNHCGTAACFAGWLGLYGKHDFKAKWVDCGSRYDGLFLRPADTAAYGGNFNYMAMMVYGLKRPGNLFESGMDRTLAEKIEQARAMANEIREREASEQR